MTTEVMDNSVNAGQQQNNDVQVQTQSNANANSGANHEDYVHKSRVNEIVQERTKQAASNAYEKALKEAEQKHQSAGVGGMAGVDESKIKSMMADVFRQQHAELQKEYEQKEIRRQLDQVAQDYLGKLEAGKDKYPDLQKRREELGDLAPLIPYLNESEDAAGVTQHLLDNGNHVASLMVLSQISPALLRKELKRLTNSIKSNQEAQTRTYPNEPLSQIVPSITTDSDSGSIEALKRQSWLRG